ncbi:MAG TPA: hypothetical protein VM123_00750 [archaeon]|nr:hypothetical protein [archaeon]
MNNNNLKYIILAVLITVFNFANLAGQEKEQSPGAEKPGKTKAVKEKAGPGQGKTEIQSEKSQSQAIKIIGFADRNRDGINDLFTDANGDGINDITGKPYPHWFKFEDKNEDKINDLFVDRDGDGVNDLSVEFIDSDSDGINDNIVDYNRDYINDISGLRYSRKSLRGYKFGFIKEERQGMMRNFIDEDADGIPDMRQRGGPGYRGGRDQFIDRDGDGIDDRRQIMQRHKKEMRGEKK